MWISYFPGAIKPYQSIRRRGAAAESFLVIAFYRIATGRDCGPARTSSSSCPLATRASGERAQQVGREIYGPSYLYIVPRFATRAGHLSDVMARDRTAIGRRSDAERELRRRGRAYQPAAVPNASGTVRADAIVIIPRGH